MPTYADPRLFVAALAILVAGIAKGVTGMGIPVIAIPVLVALYGDLRIVLPVTILATILSDIAMLVRWRRGFRELTTIVPFALAGLVGIVVGTHVLVIVQPRVLSLVLAAVLVAFLVASWLRRLPTLERKAALRFGAPIGFLGGVVQGAAGASGPIVTSYLVSTKMPRGTFLLAINVLFGVLDTTQGAALAQLGLLAGNLLPLSVAVCAVTAIGLAVGFAIQGKINDRAFRQVILVLLAIATVSLVVRALA